ncbi:hypothetical protein P9112_002431 [Eukaryota sp. TZLM1-RC]
MTPKPYTARPKTAPWALLKALAETTTPLGKSDLFTHATRYLPSMKYSTLSHLSKSLIPKALITYEHNLYSITDAGRQALTNKPKASNLTTKQLLSTINRAEINEISVLVDHREEMVKKQNLVALSLHNIHFYALHLSVGDFSWAIRTCFGDFALPFLIERKSVSDLRKSILDRRLNEQRDRMKHFSKFFPTLILIVVGKVGGDSQEYKSIRTASLRSDLEEGLLVQVVKNEEEFCNFLVYFTELIKKFQESLLVIDDLNERVFWDGNELASLSEIVAHSDQKSVLNSQFDSERKSTSTTWKQMLRCVKGFGPETIDVIAKRFPSPFSLIAFVSDSIATDTDPIQVISQLVLGSGGRLGESKARSLLMALGIGI